MECGRVDYAPVGVLEKGKVTFKRILFPVLIAVVAIAVIIAGFKIVSGLTEKETDREDLPVVYLKDGSNMLLRSVGKKESITLSDNAYGTSPYGGVKISKDGERVFFADDCVGYGQYDNGTFNLYYRVINQKKAKGKGADYKGNKIDSNVSSFSIDENGDKVFYLKEGKLYFTNLKGNAVKIDSGVDKFYVCSDTKHIIYIKDGDRLYVSSVKKKNKPEKIASGVEEIYFIRDEDGLSKITYKEFYYRKDDKLYYKKSGKDAVKVSEDVVDVIDNSKGFYILCESGEAEFTVDGREQTQLLYTLSEVKNTSLKEISKDVLEYDKYEMTLKINETLSGKEFPEESDYENDCVFAVIDENGKLIKFAGFDLQNLEDTRISDNRKYLYCIENKDESEYTGNLVRYAVKPDGLGKKDVLAEDVYSYTVYDKAVIIETKSGNDRALGVYDSSYKELTTDNYQWLYEVEADGTFYYIDDLRDGSGTLVRYKDGKQSEIDDHVYSEMYDRNQFIDTRSSDMCYYIKDYNNDRGYGDLYINKGKKSELIDERVTSILY